MKTPIADMRICWKNGRSGSSPQRWLREECADCPGFYYLLSEAFPSRVLAIRPGTGSHRARLDLCELQRGAHRQMWRLDSEGRLVSKFRSTVCVSITGGRPEQDTKLRLEQLGSGVQPHQAWAFQPVVGGAELIASALKSYVIDVGGDSDSRELCYLARWMKEPGVCQLRYAVYGWDGATSSIIIKRLGKQLGPGYGGMDYADSTFKNGRISSDCVLKDIQDGRSSRRSPAQAAQQLLAVACFLRRMHLDGHTHNDLHSGNILRNDDSESSPYSVIDLGSTCEAGTWASCLGASYDEEWSITRDWRAFAMHFVSLIDGRAREIWDLIGTNDDFPLQDTEWAVPYCVNVSVRAANGSASQKWLINQKTGQIYNRQKGKVLDVSGDDGCSVLAFTPHSGRNQKWRVVGNSIRNAATNKRLGMEGSRVVADAANGGSNQQWIYDKVSEEIVNPASCKVLDASGETRFPKDVQELMMSFCEPEHSTFVQLLKALFAARSDPNEICTLLGLLASQAPVNSGPTAAVVPKQLPRGRAHAPWRGVNLGGWLLLEPGPSCGLFEKHCKRNGQKVRCEWDLLEIMIKKGALADLEQHRQTHITKQDFIEIKEMGLNSVRIPFGYWVVLGPQRNAPYQGPALEYIDLAVDWAEEVGLQVLLDLHGCPGGESPDAPCGRRVRPAKAWNWKKWNFSQSLRALEKLAQRYCGRACVTGIQVCNEPCTSVPVEKLCQYYDRAISTVRSAGMPADRVAVVLPVFQREVVEVAKTFASLSAGKHSNYCFDMHYYHCFNGCDDWKFAQHLREIQWHRKEIEQFPICVGEWSLALGKSAAKSRCFPAKETHAIFGRVQRTAYDEASHGWFFWTWKDSNGVDWDWRRACRYEEGSLTCPPPQQELQPCKAMHDVQGVKVAIKDVRDSSTHDSSSEAETDDTSTETDSFEYGHWPPSKRPLIMPSEASSSSSKRRRIIGKSPPQQSFAVPLSSPTLSL